MYKRAKSLLHKVEQQIVGWHEHLILEHKPLRGGRLTHLFHVADCPYAVGLAQLLVECGISSAAVVAEELATQLERAVHEEVASGGEGLASAAHEAERALPGGDVKHIGA
eukprot:scaffold50070_cov112-Isochrysis_galbana.AAC.4